MPLGLMALLLGLGCTTSLRADVAAQEALAGVQVVAASAKGGAVTTPEHIVDGKPETEMHFPWGNGGASVLLDLGGPTVVEGLRVTNGHDNRLHWVTEVEVGADAEHLRPLLGRPVNLAMWRPADTITIPLPPSACRYMRVSVGGGGATGSISEIRVLGRQNRPERHLMCWSGDVQRDFLDKLDYLQHDLGVTDLWLDYVATGFPQTNRNSGFDVWVDTGALEELRGRGINYWLGEHEALSFLVRIPADLHDDRKWETTLRQMRHIYRRARDLGFRGLVYDAEDYLGRSPEIKERYREKADFVDVWCFDDEFGPAGGYYQRGLQVGRVIRQTWGCPLMQVYEARMYTGKGDCRAGNYWWLKGIHDAGVQVWIATEKTYGAGEGEIVGTGAPEHVTNWFVSLPQFVGKVFDAYPFAARVLPGFHPWNVRLGKPNYLPKYLDEQLRQAANCVQGYWIYTEGTRRAGDPTDTLDAEFCESAGARPTDYLDVLKKHPTSRFPEGKPPPEP